MKILFSTFLVILMMIILTTLKAQVVFDPATCDTIKLPAGMSIVEIKGVKYLQAVLNGWNSTFPVDSVIIGPGKTHLRAKIKYGDGVSGSLFSVVNTCVGLNRPAGTQLHWYAAKSIESFTTHKMPIAFGDTIAGIQLAGQSTVDWNPVVGDTLWVGKIVAVTYDTEAVFDPNSIDPEDIPAGMSIVEKDGTKYLQAVLNGWNSTFSIDPFIVKSGKTHLRAKIKYGDGVSGSLFSVVNTCVGINRPAGTQLHWYAAKSTESFTIHNLPIAVGDTIAGIQLAGQSTVDWNPVVGDTLWVGKIRAISVDPLVIFDPAQFDASELPAGMSIVSLSGVKYLKATLNGWNSFFNIDPFITPARTTNSTCMAKYEVGTSGFELSNIMTFLKFSNPDGVEEGYYKKTSTAEFQECTIPLAPKDTLGVFQMAGQETTGWNATIGDYIYVGKITVVQAPETAPITFVVDDSNSKTSTGFGLKGSWITKTGVYDANWDSGAEHTKFFDDGTHGDKTAGDNKWSITLNLVVDTGVNNWEWGINNSKGAWVLVGANQKFTVPNAKAQTLTYTNTVSVKNLNTSMIKVYPNPASNMINIEGGDIKSVEILTITGSKVIVSNNSQINVSTLAKGTYIAKAVGINGEVSMSKFNKQ